MVAIHNSRINNTSFIKMNVPCKGGTVNKHEIDALGHTHPEASAIGEVRELDMLSLVPNRVQLQASTPSSLGER